MEVDNAMPLYNINVAAELLGISARTLREYEKAGFIKPARFNGNRRFSNNDIEFVKNVRFYLEEIGMSIPALKLLYMTVPCWELKQCKMTDCPAYGNVEEKCWETISKVNMSSTKTCEGCPIFLTYQKNKGMKLHPDNNAGPTCFDVKQDDAA